MKLHYKLLFCMLFTSIAAWGFGDVDFDRSNGFDLMHKYSAKYLEADADAKINLLRENYARLEPSKIHSNSNLIIPKIIHQVWFGNEPIPKNYQYFLETWRQYHPDWQVKIWTEADILKENFDSIDLFLLARSYAEQSDIMRYEIIQRYGGLYIDTDVECYASFEELHYKYDFYTNMEPPALNKKRVTIANNMIAAVPNHPIIKQTLVNIRNNWHEAEKVFEKNYSNSWSKFGRSSHNLAVQRTMYPYSDAVFSFLKSEDQSKYKSIILPSGYNIPIYFVNNMPIVNFLSKLLRDKAKLSNQIVIQPETMSFHFYDKQNSLMSKQDFATSIFNKNAVKGSLYKLLEFYNKYYLAFRDLYNRNFPTNVDYHIKPVIPQVIHLGIDKLSKQDVEALKIKWQAINPFFQVKLFDYKTIELPKKLKAANERAIKLISTLYLLEKEGGVYVHSVIKPISLKEMHYKYGYYGKFVPLDNIFEPLNVDTRVMAFVKDHAIIRNLLSDIEKEITESKDITTIKIRQLYLDNAYKYYQVDGRSIILPGLYFK